MKNIVFLSLSGAIILIFLGVYFSLNVPNQYSPKEEIFCNSLHYSSDNSLNFVFLGGSEKSSEYKDFMLNTGPFSTLRDKINIYQIESEPECSLYKGIALLCDSSSNRKIASNCPNDIILFHKPEILSIRSSASNNIVSLNENLPNEVLTHELGHAISKLAEEYVNNQNPPIASKNCKSSCEFEGLEESCSLIGCSQDTLLRSIDEGVMRTLDSNEYGEFNNKLISEKINSHYERNKPPSQESYIVKGSFENGVPVIKEINPIKGKSSNQESNSEYNYEITSDSGEVVYQAGLVDSYFFTDGLESGELSGEMGEITDFYQTIPNLPYGENINIYNSNGDLINSYSMNSFITEEPCLI